MAIEFDCPYCTATLRVPDAAMGKAGTCPKCDSSLTVPVLEIPKPKQEFPVEVVSPASRLPVSQDQPPVQEQAPPLIPDPPASASPENPFPFLEPETPVAAPQPAAPAVTPAGEFPLQINTAVATPSVAKRLKKKKKHRTFGLVAPVLFVMFLVGSGYALYVMLQPRFSGEISATLIPAEKIPPVRLPKSRIEGKPTEVLEMLSAMELSPENFVSELIQTRLSGSRTALSVEVMPGVETEFYRVNLMRFPAVKQFFVENAAELNRPRARVLNKTLEDFISDVTSGTAINSPENIVKYRDNLALCVTANSLGYHVEAVVGKRTFRCVYQDDVNRLYFLLPVGTDSFAIRPREFSEKDRVLPEGFYFKVTSVGKEKKREQIRAVKDSELPDTTVGTTDVMPSGEMPNGAMPGPEDGTMQPNSMAPEGAMSPSGSMSPKEMMKPGDAMKPDGAMPSQESP